MEEWPSHTQPARTVEPHLVLGRKDVLIHATVRMSLGTCSVNKARHKSTCTVGSHLHEMSRRGESREGRLGLSRVGTGRTWKGCFLCLGDENVLELSTTDGCTRPRMC